MYKRTIVIAFLSILVITLSNCKEKSLSLVEEYDFTTQFENEGIELHQIASHIEYIPLEVNDESVFRLGHPFDAKWVHIVDSFIFIMDQEQPALLSFNSSGEFLTRIGATGRGPGEFISIVDLAVCQKERQIMVLCPSPSKIIIYGFDGVFQKEIMLEYPLRPWQIVCYQGRIVGYFPRGVREEVGNYAFAIINMDGTIDKQLLDRSSDVKVAPIFGHTIIGKLYHIRIGNNLHLCEADHATISVMDSSFNIIRTIQIVIDRRVNPIIPYIGKGYREYIGPVNKLTSLTLTHSHIFLFMETENRLVPYVYFKDYSVAHKLTMRRNRINNGPSFWPQGVAFDGRVFSLTYGADFLRRLNAIHPEGEEFIPSERLAALMESDDFHDTPILTLVTLKDSIPFFESALNEQ